jgi:hypothetical protein
LISNFARSTNSSLILISVGPVTDAKAALDPVPSQRQVQVSRMEGKAEVPKENRAEPSARLRTFCESSRGRMEVEGRPSARFGMLLRYLEGEGGGQGVEVVSWRKRGGKGTVHGIWRQCFKAVTCCNRRPERGLETVIQAGKVSLLCLDEIAISSTCQGKKCCLSDRT